jgi:hypothetical protein
MDYFSYSNHSNKLNYSKVQNIFVRNFNIDDYLVPIKNSFFTTILEGFTQENELNESNQKIENLKKDIGTISNKINDLNNLKNIKQNEHDSITNTKYDGEENDNNNLIKSIITTKDSKQAGMDDLNNKNTTLTKQIDELTLEISKLTADNSKETTEKEQLDKNNIDLDKKITDLNNDYNTKKKSIESTITNLTTTLDKLKKTLDESKKVDCPQLDKSYSVDYKWRHRGNHSHWSSYWQQNYVPNQSCIDNKTNIISKIEKDINDNTNTKNSKQTELDNLIKKYNDDTVKTINSYKQDITKNDKRIKELLSIISSRNEATQKLVKEKNNSLESLKTQKNANSDVIQNLNKTITDLMTQLNAANDAKKKIQEKKQKYIQDNETLKKQLISSIQEINKNINDSDQQLKDKNDALNKEKDILADLLLAKEMEVNSSFSVEKYNLKTPSKKSCSFYFKKSDYQSIYTTSTSNLNKYIEYNTINNRYNFCFNIDNENNNVIYSNLKNDAYCYNNIDKTTNIKYAIQFNILVNNGSLIECLSKFIDNGIQTSILSILIDNNEYTIKIYLLNKKNQCIIYLKYLDLNNSIQSHFTTTNIDKIIYLDKEMDLNKKYSYGQLYYSSTQFYDCIVLNN